MVSFIRFVGGSCICSRGTRASLLSLGPASLHGSLFLRSSGLQHLRFKKTRQKLYNDEPVILYSARRGDTPIQGQAFKVLLISAEEKMTGSVAHYEKQMAVLESRAIGRVMPSLIEGVKVPNLLGDVRYKLRDVASIGVKEGTTLVVTVFEPSMLRLVERALFDSKIKGVAPQIVNENTIRVPMPKPTVESRNEFVKDAGKQAEVTRIQVRQIRQTSMKDSGCDKNSPEGKSVRHFSFGWGL
ncbi:hypothetical protein BS47DRAFT_1290488 [Hydnum rufescens UP504]|uniref:Ribosome recycling factor domain-containing protein n=1 Tax=Hydnum rufescens UP504 TaxID=1448309 RepID=A0A9P6E0G4_9AGAM|nr:hypothetical protein BS47DRAFT_1290488 [Hydnum rufescens UP504]